MNNIINYTVICSMALIQYIVPFYSELFASINVYLLHLCMRIVCILNTYCAWLQMLIPHEIYKGIVQIE